MKILVTRHGQTGWNVEKRIQGRTDIELNNKGIEQAYQTKENLKNEKIDLIICSPLKRAKQTADIINIDRNIPIIYDERLIEICYGENEGRLHNDFDYDGFWNIINTHEYKDAENVNRFIKRVHDFLEDIKKYKQENILIVTHNGVCRAINIYFNGIPEDKNIINLGIKNCEVVNYKIPKDNKFVVYAHRGASAYAPENTKVAFEKAIELKANGIELDLQKTKDGKIVIFHDDYIDKKSNGSGKIEEYTYQELLELDFGSWFNDKYKNEKIVLFEDFARDYLDKDLTFAIELKVLGIEQETIKVINKYKTHNNIYITSFLYDALKNVRKIDSNIKLSWLIEDRIGKENIEMLLKINGTQICPRASLVSKEDIEFANNNEVGVRLWEINNEEIMQEVYKLNIEGMTVNFPDKLIELLNKEKHKEIEPFNDNVIYETENFVVAVPKVPHIPRTDGGHLWIRAKKKYFSNRIELEPKLAIEVMRLTMLLGEAMEKGMKNRGINIERINYQENGNWAYQKGMNPEFHIHLYGRTKDSITQTWGEALIFPNKSTGFYDKFERFNNEDIEEIKRQIDLLEKEDKYNLVNWRL